LNLVIQSSNYSRSVHITATL